MVMRTAVSHSLFCRLHTSVHNMCVRLLQNKQRHVGYADSWEVQGGLRLGGLIMVEDVIGEQRLQLRNYCQGVD